jgi:transposase
LQIYLDYDNSLGAYKIRRVLERDYGIQISLGRVYRLINTMNLPKRSTEKPKFKNFVKTDEGSMCKSSTSTVQSSYSKLSLGQ